MNYIFALLGAGIVGICIAMEPAINSGLGKSITPRLATLHSFLIGTVVILLFNLFAGGFKEYKMIYKTPPYFWIGGLLGAVVVYGGAKVTPSLGVATTLTVMVSVQLIAGIIIDSLGLFGASKVPLDMSRVLGVLLIVAAVKLIVK